MEKLSVFITTYNNDRTLRACLESVRWADEIILLDSGSDDDTLIIASEFNCTISTRDFAGYGPQKQAALELTTHRWVLLMDADEVLSESLQEEIRQLLETVPDKAGYTMPRQEQMFWRMQSLSSRLNHYLRLFDKTRGRISDMPIHAAPEVEGELGRLQSHFVHYGETCIHSKVDRINHYSTGLVEDKIRKNPGWLRTRMVLYPGFAFLKSYLFKRNFLNGWAGFIASVCMSHYAFLKYAKLYEYHQTDHTVH